MRTLSTATPLALNPVACAAGVDPTQVIALTKLIVFVDYAAVGAMRTVLPFYAKSLGAAATGLGALEAPPGGFVAEVVTMRLQEVEVFVLL